MQRTLSTVGLLALLASGLILGAHTALADEHEARTLTYEVGTAIEPLTLPADSGRQRHAAVYVLPHAGFACWLDV